MFGKRNKHRHIKPFRDCVFLKIRMHLIMLDKSYQTQPGIHVNSGKYTIKQFL